MSLLLLCKKKYSTTSGWPISTNLLKIHYLYENEKWSKGTVITTSVIAAHNFKASTGQQNISWPQITFLKVYSQVMVTARCSEWQCDPLEN